MIPTVMKIFLSDEPSSAVEVPITPNTTANDVIECCKEPGETSCHLAEVFRDKERCIGENEKPYNILQQWGSLAAEVKFYLRHYDNPSKNKNAKKQNDWPSGNEMNLGYIASNGRITTPNGVDMTLKELKEIAQKQQQQIELQQQTLLGKEQRLRFLRKQMQQQQAAMSENEKLKRLREKAEAQEAKLRKIRALRGKVDQQRYENTTMSSELEAVQTLFEEKHVELSAAVLKVQELTNQLDELRKGKLSNSNFSNNPLFMNLGSKGVGEGQTNELSKLKKEMLILNRMNEEQQKRLDEQRSVLKKRNEDASDLDRRIEELTNLLRQKKLASAQDKGGSGVKSKSHTPTTRMHTIVAAVEPLVKQTDPVVSSPLLKTPISPYGQSVSPGLGPHNSKTGRSIVGRIDQAPLNGTFNNQTDGLKKQSQSVHPQNFLGYAKQNNRDGYGKPMMPSNAIIRPQSSLAQLHSDASSKHDPTTAKVRPMLVKSQSSNMLQYPSQNPNNARSASTLSSSKPGSGGANIFAYKPPPAATSTSDAFTFNGSTVKVLPSGNIRYLQSPYSQPPPYPSSIPENASGHHMNLRGHPDSAGRSITVDIEALRRKLAHAPRPLKKRSSITEPERPQGPAIPRLIYDQLYKKADTPFYRPPTDQTHRSTPPPAYTEPTKLPPPPPPLKQKPSKTGKEDSTDPSESISYESNLTPTQFLKQQKVERKHVDTREKQPDPTSFAASDDDYDDDEFEDDGKRDGDNASSDENVESSSDASFSDFPPPPMPSLSLVPTKGILKPLDAPSKGANRHIKFDPLALLLDASLEGEFDLVKKIIHQVSDASGANDEGITALHNAVCAGHFDLVKFLVHYGSDINAADTDGWTPLHCAASCNNLSMCRFLVENGACIFAATLSDRETAADKCEEQDEGYMACSEFLYGFQEKLGIARQGQVYALYDYDAVNDDELSFRDGDLLTVTKKGDENEKEWYMACKNDQEGYIPRNLIGMWPRIKPHREENE